MSSRQETFSSQFTIRANTTDPGNDFIKNNVVFAQSEPTHIKLAFKGTIHLLSKYTCVLIYPFIVLV